MTIPLALQIYTVRNELAKDFQGVIERVAGIGYAGVEVAGLPGDVTPEKAYRLFHGLGLQVCGAHLPLPLGDQKSKVLEIMQALSSKDLVCAYQPQENFASAEAIKGTAEKLNEAAQVAKDAGLRFSYHNHWWEYLPVDGVPAYQTLLEHLSPDVNLEVDTYWVQTAGQDPAAVVRELGSRAPLLHLKDGPAVKGKPMTAVGEGVLDFPAIVSASRGAAEWLIVEMDECEGDTLEAVEQSYRYLVEKRLGHGR
jgi:sugar phosphate isomerase/epimerase